MATDKMSMTEVGEIAAKNSTVDNQIMLRKRQKNVMTQKSKIYVLFRTNKMNW